LSPAESRDESRVRIDKWLWAARFFKTRGLATEAVEGGKVHVNGERVKAARAVRLGDRLEVRRGPEVMEVVVLALSGQRGPAPAAQALYEETAPSQARREALAEQRRLLGPSAPVSRGRPDKRSRRRIIQFRQTNTDE
jgi:ribosome-associated heat shock protein Hsp15